HAHLPRPLGCPQGQGGRRCGDGRGGAARCAGRRAGGRPAQGAGGRVMETRASSRFVRLTAQKARLVVDLIRGKPVERAIALLEYTPKRGAKTVLKTL